jgi:hypothetical protein
VLAVDGSRLVCLELVFVCGAQGPACVCLDLGSLGHEALFPIFLFLFRQMGAEQGLNLCSRRAYVETFLSLDFESVDRVFDDAPRDFNASFPFADELIYLFCTKCF